ncbi:MAG: FtsW/RodA/SpoVE family cell cycle protein, partial [Solirubrobacterales bacterium]
AGAKMRHLAILAGALGVLVLIAVMMEPYRMARLTSFVHPSADPSGAGFQGTQASIALGSGGIFGVGIGESVQKAFYLPEAHTDMIAAVIGEELGLIGINVLVGLYMLLGYAGFRTAQRAKDRYGRLLAAGLTAMILVQASINLFAVLGLAPLTGVTLPFVSYGNSSLIVTLAAVGLLLNISNGGTATAGAATSRRPLRVVAGGRAAAPQAKRNSGGARAAGGDRGRRDGGSRRAGAGRSRRAR